MEITIFAKKRLTKEGKPFFSFLSTLKKKDGTDLVCGTRPALPKRRTAP